MKRNQDGKNHGDPHLVPLPAQAVEILKALKSLTGKGVLVFPGERSVTRPISDGTLRAALATLGCTQLRALYGFLNAKARVA